MAFRRFDMVGHLGSGVNGEQAVGCGFTLRQLHALNKQT